MLRGFLLTNLEPKEGQQDSWQWRVNLESIAANIEMIGDMRPKEDAVPFHGPVLFVRGSESGYIRDTDEVNRLFPHATIQSIEKAGHWVHWEQPAAFLNVASSFLSQHCPPFSASLPST